MHKKSKKSPGSSSGASERLIYYFILMEPHAFTGVVPVFIRQQIVRGDIRRSDFVCAFIRGFTTVVFCAKADKSLKQRELIVT